MGLEAQQFYDTLPASILAPDLQHLDFNAILPHGRSVIAHFIEQEDILALSNLLANIVDRVAVKNITIDFAAANLEGIPIFKLIVDKCKFDMMHFQQVLNNLFQIHINSANKIDWNAPIFLDGGNIMHECARLGLDHIVQPFVTRRDSGGLPVFNINQENADSKTIMDLYKTRFDSQAIPPMQDDDAPGMAMPIIPGFNRQYLMQIMTQFRKMGSHEPKAPFSPATARLDRDNIHNNVNELVINRILDSLHQKFPDIALDTEVADLYNFLLYRCNELDRDLVDHGRIGMSNLIDNASLTIRNLHSLLESGDAEGNITEHNMTWNFKRELAYLWKDAKATHNEFGLAATIQELHSCWWGQLVNLCHVAEDGDQLNLKDPNSPHNNERLEVVLAEVHRGAEALDHQAEITDLVTKFGESVDLRELLSDSPAYERVRAELPYLWAKVKAKSLEAEFIDALRDIDADPHVQLLKICHAAELTSKSYPTAFDYSSMHGNEMMLQRISEEVLQKLQAANPNRVQNKAILKAWAESHEKQIETPARLLVHGMFNDVLIDMAQRERGSPDILYSKDFEEWQTVTVGIATELPYYDSQKDARNSLYELGNYNFEVEAFVQRVTNDNFIEELEAYNEAHGALDLRARGFVGIPLACQLLWKFAVQAVSAESLAIVRALTDPAKVQIDWFMRDHIPPIGFQGPIPGQNILQIFYQNFGNLGDDIILLLVRAISAQAIPQDAWEFSHALPSHHKIKLDLIKHVLSGYMSSEEFTSLSCATNFVNIVQVENFEAELVRYNAQYGVLDLNARDIYGNSLSCNLLYKFFPGMREDKDRATHLVELLSDTGKVKMNWLARDINLTGFTELPEAAALPGQLALAIFHQNFVGFLGDQIIPIMLQFLSQGRIPTDICDSLIFPNSPDHLVILKNIIESGISFEQYKSIHKVETFISRATGCNFIKELDDYLAENGSLDLTQIGTNGEPVLAQLIRKVQTFQEFDDILMAIIYNEHVQVDWYVEGRDHETALEVIYRLIPDSAMRLNILATICQCVEIGIPNDMRIHMMDLHDGPMHLAALDDILGITNYAANTAF